MTDEPRPQPPAKQSRKSANVGSRVAEAKRGAALAEADVVGLSAKKLAILKQLPLSRLARLAPDPDLTEADARELRHWIADRTGRSGSSVGRIKVPFGGSTRRPRRVTSFAGMTVALLGLLVVAGLGTAHVRTPARFTELTAPTSLVVRLKDGTYSRITLPKDTVILRDGENTREQTIEGRYWVAGHGYQSVTIMAGR